MRQHALITLSRGLPYLIFSWHSHAWHSPHSLLRYGSRLSHLDTIIIAAAAQVVVCTVLCFLLPHGTQSHNFKLSRSISTTRQGNKNVYLFGFVSFSIGSSVRRLRHSYEFSGDNKYVDFLLQKTKKISGFFLVVVRHFVLLLLQIVEREGKKRKHLRFHSSSNSGRGYSSLGGWH